MPGQLGQFVEVVGAQETADAGQSRVIVLLQQFLALFLCVDHHAAELVDVKRPSAQSDALLLVDGRPATQFDGQPADQNKRREDNQTQGRHDEIKEPFHATTIFIWLIQTLTRL